MEAIAACARLAFALLLLAGDPTGAAVQHPRRDLEPFHSPFTREALPHLSRGGLFSHRESGWNESPTERRRRSTGLLIGAGILGGAVGFFGGGLAGIGLSDCEDGGEDFCGLVEGFFGAAAGETALIPLGIHLANGRQGNYGLELLASAAIAGAGLAVAFAVDDGWPLIPVPPAQIAASIAIERAASGETQAREDERTR